MEMDLLEPFAGVETGTGLADAGEVAVTEDLGIGEVNAEAAEQFFHGDLLSFGTGVGRTTLGIESAFVADAQTVGVVAADMRTGLCHGTERLYIAVPADVIVITCAGEAPAQVVCCQVMFGVATVTAGSGTVNDDEVDKSHFY